MIQPTPFDQLLARDPLAPTHAAIVATVKTLLPGVSIVKHPGKVDLSELVSKNVVNAPGVGIGWSRVRQVNLADGAYCFAVEWVAYVVAEAKAVGGKRVEKEDVALAIGSRLLAILGDADASFWGRGGILPPEEKPGPELKPLFTIRDASQGTAYYTVTWTQTIADLGSSYFPQAVGRADPDQGTINYVDAEELEALKKWIPALEVGDDA